MNRRIYIITWAMCSLLSTQQLKTIFMPSKHDVASYVRTVSPGLMLAPVLVYGTQALLNLQKKPVRIPTPLPEPARKLGYLTLSGNVVATEKFHEALKKCLDEPKIEGIIIKIDAEWGMLGACQTMFKELQRAAQQKPVVALIEKSCCREPYLIATAATCIIANEHATVGMIGTVAAFTEYKPDPNKEISYFYAGKLTPLGDANHHITSQEQQLIAEQLEMHYQQMCTTISIQRKLSLDEIAIWAEGKPFLGLQAQELQLIDRIGTLSDAYDAINELLAKKHERSPGKFELVAYTI